MKFLVVILIALTFGACSNSGSDSRNVSMSSDTAEAPDAGSLDATDTEPHPAKKEIIVKNTSDYSEKFIHGLQALGFEKIELKDSLFIINDEDTICFSGVPKIGKQIVLTGKQGDLVMALTVRRINYTTIDYRIEMVELGKASHNETGQADVNTVFFLGAESDVSEKTGTGYLVTEFAEYKNTDCYTYIRLGYEEETGPYLLGKLIKNCNGAMEDIDLDSFTTLIEK